MYMIYVNVFLCSQKRISVESDKYAKFPNTPSLYKSPNFGNVMSRDMMLTKVGYFYNGGPSGNYMSFVGSN